MGLKLSDKPSVKLRLHNVLSTKIHVCLKFENVVDTGINDKQICLLS